jgi:hypothetical protein
MSRHAIGDRPMTSSERQRRYLAKLAGSKTVPPPLPAVGAGVPVNIEHLRLYPDRVAPWLCQRLGHDAALALYNALGRALGEITG